MQSAEEVGDCGMERITNEWEGTTNGKGLQMLPPCWRWSLDTKHWGSEMFISFRSVILLTIFDF